MPDVLDFDFEGLSEVDLPVDGLDRYSAHPSTKVTMCSWSINGGTDYLWEAHRAPIPAELAEAIEDPEVHRWAWNAQFERVMANRVLGLKMPIKNTYCTQVLSYMMSFAGRLEDVGPQVGLPADRLKLQTGKKLIKTFCVPQKPTANQPHVWRNWVTDPELWEEFGTYCLQDNDTEKAIKSRLIKFPIQESEWELYWLDQEINDRGLPIDMQFVRNGLAMAKRRKAELIAEMERLTGVSNGNSPTQLTEWLVARGYPFRDINKDTVTKVIAENADHEGEFDENYIDRAVFDVLKLRQNSGKTSYTKWEKLINTVGADGNLRYTFQFAGAGRTSRWSGRGFQPHNLVRTPKELLNAIFDEDENGKPHGDWLETATQLVRDNDYDGVCLILKEPMTTLTGIMRSSICAPEGKELRVRDLASIETCVTAWLSGCRRLLKVFADKKDPYIDFATDFYKKPYAEVTKAERQIAKPPVLGCTYRLGGGELKEGKRTGLWAYAESMGVNFTQEESNRAVKVFRTGYPEVPALWYALEEASTAALQDKGRCVRVTIKMNGEKRPVPVTFEYRKPFLMVRLPSGRYLYYHLPRLTQETRIGKPTEDFPDGKPYKKLVVSYMGRKDGGHGWVRIYTHGGKFTENLVQAIARDILKVGLLRAKKFGFRIVGHVHDEILALIRKGDNYFTGELLGRLMTALIDWCPDLPLAAAGWSGGFYKKD